MDSCYFGHLGDGVAEEDLERQHRHQVHKEPRTQVVAGDDPSIIHKALSTIKVSSHEIEQCINKEDSIKEPLYTH